jgi:hypothetical protein
MKITARIEQINKPIAEKYLATMVLNRSPKELTIAAYANDMANGKWLLSPQGIAFNEEGQLFDGQHRLKAIIRSGVDVEILVLRGFPDKQESMKTMDVLDAGVGRSLADRLKLMGCYHGNPNLACAVARQIAGVVMGINNRASNKPTLSAVLEILKIYKKEMQAVCAVMDRPQFRHVRNGYTIAAFVIAAVVDVNKLDLDMGRLTTGAGLDQGSPILELRNSFFGEEDLHPRAKTILCLSALYCAWHGIQGRAFHKPEIQAAALEFFQSKQPTRFSRVEKLFFVGVESKQS